MAQFVPIFFIAAASIIWYVVGYTAGRTREAEDSAKRLHRLMDIMEADRCRWDRKKDGE